VTPYRTLRFLLVKRHLHRQIQNRRRPIISSALVLHFLHLSPTFLSLPLKTLASAILSPAILRILILSLCLQTTLSPDRIIRPSSYRKMVRHRLTVFLLQFPILVRFFFVNCDPPQLTRISYRITASYSISCPTGLQFSYDHMFPDSSDSQLSLSPDMPSQHLPGASRASHRTPNVYINGLPPHFPEQELFALTRPFGEVKSVRSFTRHVSEKPTYVRFCHGTKFQSSRSGEQRVWLRFVGGYIFLCDSPADIPAKVQRRRFRRKMYRWSS
jgi:hypothetical protein